MALIVEEEDNRFRVCWQEYSIISEKNDKCVDINCK